MHKHKHTHTTSMCTSFDISFNSNKLLTLIPWFKVSHAIIDSHSSTTHLMPINNVVAGSHLSFALFFFCSCFLLMVYFYCQFECSLSCLVEKCHCWFIRVLSSFFLLLFCLILTVSAFVCDWAWKTLAFPAIFNFITTTIQSVVTFDLHWIYGLMIRLFGIYNWISLNGLLVNSVNMTSCCQ